MWHIHEYNNTMLSTTVHSEYLAVHGNSDMRKVCIYQCEYVLYFENGVLARLIYFLCVARCKIFQLNYIQLTHIIWDVLHGFYCDLSIIWDSNVIIPHAYQHH